MGSEIFVVDLSSDDEEFGVGVDVGDSEFSDWVEKLLAGEEGESDDVVVVDELSGPPAAKEMRNSNVSVQKDVNCGGGEESDDDCLVLDSDPEKSIRVVEDKVEKGGEEEDELVVVQEKGQVACRDFPHPRHHCANFPFNSSEHVQHCKLCHCYVCDCLAPCMHWGNGESPTDHCHSTDKDETWRTERQNFKLKTISDSDELPDNILTNVPPVQNLVQQPNQVQLITPLSTSNPLMPSSGASSIRSHSSNNQSHHQLPSPLSYCSQRYAPSPARPNPLIPATHAVQRETHNSSYLAPQCTQYRTRFKRVAMTQSGLTLHNNALNGISNNQIARPFLGRSYSVPSRFQRSQHPQPGLQAPDYLISAATVVGTNQQVGSAVPERFQPVPTPLPGYLGQLGTPVNDSMHNWPVTVASLAYDHGVSGNMTEGTRIGDSIAAIYSQSLNYSTSAIPQMNTDQYLNICPQYASVDGLNPLGNYSSQINSAAVNDFAEHGPARELVPSTLQLPYSLPLGNNLNSSDVSFESIFAYVEKEMLEEPAIDMPIPELDPESSFFDIGFPWCSFPQIGNHS